MKRVLWGTLALVMVFAVGYTNFAWGQGTETVSATKTPGKKPGVVVARTVTGKVTVQAVDVAARTLTVKLPDGKVQTFKVEPAVKRLDEIKAGDEITATRAESVALYVRKSNEPPAKNEVQTVQIAPKDAKPGVIATDTSEITAKVEAVDYDNRTLTLKGPEGNITTLAVDKRVKRFKAVKVGDELVLRVTNSMLIAVETPAK